MIPLLLAVVIGHPNGLLSHCNPNDYTLPDSMGHIVDQSNLDAINCQLSVCTVTSAVPFKGILISSSGTLESNDASLQRGLNEHCLTHVSNTEKTTVEFTVNGRATLWIVLVLQRQNILHQVNLIRPYPVNIDFTTYIIGAGPGGISAARALESFNAPVHLLEKGPDLPNNFYFQQIRNTYLDNIDSTRKCSPLGTSPVIACQYSGNQGANGAIFKPGTAKDFANSIGVSHTDATLAQNEAASYVETDESNGVTYTWKCLNATCNRSYVASSNDKTARRSVAFNGVPWYPKTVEFNKPVQYVGQHAIHFNDGTSIHLGQDDCMILAAGALGTPQLLNITSFSGWNHYYDFHLGPPVAQQSITYDADSHVETNIANLIHPNGTTLAITIEMLMVHDVVESFRVNEPWSPAGATVGSKTFSHDAYHYAGTVNHDRLWYADNIFIGDASALSKSFNCHTSMPAAAAGVLAAKRVLNLLQNTTLSRSKVGGLTSVGVWFAPGVFAIALAVVCHIAAGQFGDTANKNLRLLHYVLSFSGVILISIGVYTAAKNRNVRVKENHAGHYYVGYLALAWLWTQAVFGFLLVVYGSLREKVGWAHRISALLLFILLLYLFFTVTLEKYPFGDMKDIPQWVAVGGVLIAVFILLFVWVLARLPQRLHMYTMKNLDTLTGSLF